MTDAELRERFNKTVAVIKATDAERLFLWMEWAIGSAWDDVEQVKRGKPHAKLVWEQMSSGYYEEIGRVDNNIVGLTMFWARIAGQVVCFWETSSAVADARLAERFLAARFGRLRRPVVTNAMNFHNAVIAIERANEGRSSR